MPIDQKQDKMQENRNAFHHHSDSETKFHTYHQEVVTYIPKQINLGEVSFYACV